MIVKHLQNEAGGNIYDNSKILNVQQNIGISEDRTSDEPQGGRNEVLINHGTGVNKTNLMRIIMALYKMGAFVSTDGITDPGPEKVFKAFSDMLGDNFDNYATILYNTRGHKNDLKIFEQMEAAFNKYEADLK